MEGSKKKVVMMKVIKRAWKAFLMGPVFFIPFGLIFFGIGAGLSYKYFTLFLHGEQTPGRVVSLAESCDDDGCSYAPVVTFDTGNGATSTYYSTYYSGPPAYDVGQSVTVIFDPQNPEDSSIKGEGNVFRIIFMSVGGIIISIGIYLFMRNLLTSPSTP
jgi:hypothetical protein